MPAKKLSEMSKIAQARVRIIKSALKSCMNEICKLNHQVKDHEVTAFLYNRADFPYRGSIAPKFGKFLPSVRREQELIEVAKRYSRELEVFLGKNNPELNKLISDLESGEQWNKKFITTAVQVMKEKPKTGQLSKHYWNIKNLDTTSGAIKHTRLNSRDWRFRL